MKLPWEFRPCLCHSGRWFLLHCRYGRALGCLFYGHCGLLVADLGIISYTLSHVCVLSNILVFLEFIYTPCIHIYLHAINNIYIYTYVHIDTQLIVYASFTYDIKHQYVNLSYYYIYTVYTYTVIFICIYTHLCKHINVFA